MNGSGEDSSLIKDSLTDLYFHSEIFGFEFKKDGKVSQTQ
jgi:hypothetical protein